MLWHNMDMIKEIRKLLILFIAFSLTFCMSCSIDSGQNDTNNGDYTDKIRIVTTIFPEYDWVREILGERIDDVELTLLLDSGVDLHSYQATAKDIMTITNSDLFIYVGGESDEWIDDVLKEAQDADIGTLSLLDIVGNDALDEEIKEGMQSDEDGEDADDAESDEHVWLSILKACSICDAIKNALCDIDPDHADEYEANEKAYKERLLDMYDSHAELIEKADKDVLVFGDRFPFRYLMDDLDLDYYAAFSGCSAESNASFQTITFLAGKVDEYDLDYVIKCDGRDDSIARSIIENTKTKDQQILQLDSMQGTTAADVQAGARYYDIMDQNLSSIERVLQ